MFVHCRPTNDDTHPHGQGAPAGLPRLSGRPVDVVVLAGRQVRAVATAPVSAWLDPLEHAPPAAKKLLLLTAGGIATIGQWGDDCVAWAPLPRVPPHLKARLASAITQTFRSNR